MSRRGARYVSFDLGSSSSGGDVVSIEASCPSGTAAGDVVRITGPAISGVYQVERVDITDLAQTPAVGVVQSTPTATSAVVVLSGIVTGYSPALVSGKQYLVNELGRLQLGKPTPGSGQIWRTQQMGFALSTDAFLVRASVPILIRG